jgi:hypothetical protein
MDGQYQMMRTQRFLYPPSNGNAKLPPDLARYAFPTEKEKNVVPIDYEKMNAHKSQYLDRWIAAGLTARMFGFKPELVASISIKSATVPIAVQIAQIVHGAPALTAIFVVLTGMIGAAFGPWLMSCFRIAHPVSRGLAPGTISHGQGTAEAATESELTGAVAGVAMGWARSAPLWPRPTLSPS